ncbi:MAG TPA: glycoside hydrolase family 32 protein [Roseiflexaceae bacterium]|nr:glycoside hydrolase family 32 protein [Roseiflexaceae bacterium]
MTPLTPRAHARRPRLHFTPPAGWINDPNGLIYHDGEYHLFYQHHPYSLGWGPMHWGHAVSRDLVHWEHLPIALAPDELGAIFSGSAVIDHHNTAGFGAGAMVAIFTHDAPARQVQSLAYSTDRGRTWTKYAGNPVLAPPDAPRDFRDPRVLWYEGTGRSHWVMLLAVGHEIWIYTSPDLKAWTKASTFGANYGAHGGVWECPELISLPVDGNLPRRWVLVVGVQQGAPGGGSGTQYFVGSFDGTTFTCDDPPEKVRWADHGADFYAAQAWASAPGDRTIWLAWMSNWAYARETPATTWHGMMTIPRELELASGPDGLVLVQRPVRELAACRGTPFGRSGRALLPGAVSLDEVRGEALELIATFRAEGATASSFGLRVRVGVGEAARIRYDAVRRELALERGGTAFRIPSFIGPQVAPLAPRDGLVTLHVLVDTASVEVFADGGRVVLTSQILPTPESVGVELFADGGAVVLEELRAWPLPECA